MGAQLGGLSRRARTIVQLKPRSPSTPLQGRPPIQAVCDYKQMEVWGDARGGLGLVPLGRAWGDVGQRGETWWIQHPGLVLPQPHGGTLEDPPLV